MTNPQVIIAPTLACERALSMDLYAENLISGFMNLPDPPSWKVVSPSNSKGYSKPVKYFLRNVVHPCQLRLAGRGKVLHVLDHSNGHLCRHHPRSVVTCHDIAEYRETALTPRQLAHWKWRVEGMRQAARIVAISNNTKEDLIEILQIPEDRINVIYYGIDELFRPHPKEAALASIPELSGPEFKILHIGSNIMRKNIPVLIRALGILRQRGFEFSWVKVGQDFPAEQKELIRKAGIEQNIIFLGSRKTEELPLIYSLCDVFVFPSTYEGFGRPILEAQQCGLPVVLAQSSCLPEIGSDGALYFHPDSEEELASRILEIQDPETRSSLVTAGFANGSRFDWTKHAAGVLEEYRAVASI